MTLKEVIRLRSVSHACPVCGRDVILREDGTLWCHYTSFFNQEDPTAPECIASNMKVVSDEELDREARIER